ncbi:hypothetical protein AcV5_004332 [Taiwanofungus camphoratus]|nr:hypothetical protein AcW2_001072 [Antrodia cinnamomea]KAI0936111.1 hypothetical protein AcV5_004332 [Antrodia cinnamomea]KAI0961321.1 hypothetical protein AcV7_000454 [Antrodia cinnamomea]
MVVAVDSVLGEAYRPPLDESFYHLSEDEAAFFKSQTGIKDDEELKRHILKAQANAYEVYPYPCIRIFSFTELRISLLPAYGQLLKLGKERKGAIFLDIGCCFGNDVRKVIADGFPMEGVMASDLRAGFWQCGHQMFNTTPETFPVPFLPGDAFDTEFLKPVPPFYSSPENPVPTLSSLTTLNPLHGHISAIHGSMFFHLFDEARQLQLAKSLAGLLSPEPGSMILGAHIGGHEKTVIDMLVGADKVSLKMFVHSPESWVEMWDGQVFKKGTVKVDASLREGGKVQLQRFEVDTKLWWLDWSVTRL